MRSQAQDVEDVIKVSAKEKKKDKPITEYKKENQKNDEKKYPTRKKVKMRKRKQREKSVDLSDQLREEQEIVEAKNRQSIDHRHHDYLERFAEKKSETGKQIQQAELQHADKGLFLEWNSWFVSLSYRRLQVKQHILGSLEDTDLYLPYSTSSNPDREDFS